MIHLWILKCQNILIKKHLIDLNIIKIEDEGKVECKFLSGRNPAELMRVCSSNKKSIVRSTLILNFVIK
jgi:hypothetical protein